MTDWRLRRWTDADLPLLEASNTPAMTRFLGAPETEAQVRRRHERYLRGWDTGASRMFAIVDDAGVAAGAMGWWPSEWDGRPVAEAGWGVLPAFQRRGAAAAALRRLIADVRAHGDHDLLCAFPSVENAASHALCRTVGLMRRGTMREEFRGVEMELTVWALDLRAGVGA